MVDVRDQLFWRGEEGAILCCIASHRIASQASEIRDDVNGCEWTSWNKASRLAADSEELGTGIDQID